MPSPVLVTYYITKPVLDAILGAENKETAYLHVVKGFGEAGFAIYTPRSVFYKIYDLVKAGVYTEVSRDASWIITGSIDQVVYRTDILS